VRRLAGSGVVQGWFRACIKGGSPPGSLRKGLFRHPFSRKEASRRPEACNFRLFSADSVR
jgi:hypothetical protein